MERVETSDGDQFTLVRGEDGAVAEITKKDKTKFSITRKSGSKLSEITRLRVDGTKDAVAVIYGPDGDIDWERMGTSTAEREIARTVQDFVKLTAPAGTLFE